MMKTGAEEGKTVTQQMQSSANILLNVKKKIIKLLKICNLICVYRRI